MIDALVVESHTVDQGAFLRNPEHARLWVAGLRPRRHRAQFDVAEAHGAERIEIVAVLVEAGSQSQRVSKLQPQACDPQILCKLELGPEWAQPAQACESRVVRKFRIEARQDRQGGPGDQRRRRAPH
jgi:hypothetical protein